MRTEAADERRESSRTAARTRSSRRTFLRGTGVLATLGTGGLASAAEGSRTAARIGATAPYLQTAEGLAGAYERSSGRRATAVRVPGRAAGATDGPAVLLSGRPVAHAAGEGTGGIGGSPVWRLRSVAVRGVAALAEPDGRWREPLPRRDVRDRWDADRPVETWSETDRDAVANLVTDQGDLDATGLACPDRDSEVLVRGPRASQYAAGRGGVAYYAVDSGDLDEGRNPAGAASATPLVRIEYLGADPHAITDAGEDFVEFYERHSRRPATIGRCFADPSVDCER